MRPTQAALLAFIGMAGCAMPSTQPTVEVVTMPRSGMPTGAGDYNRAALSHARSAFLDIPAMHGKPDRAAFALGELEYLAAITATPIFDGVAPTVPIVLQRGRAEARAALGFKPDAPAQLAIDALYGTSEALLSGNRQAAAAAIAPLTLDGNGEAALGRLAALPPLPQVVQGLAIAHNEIVGDIGMSGSR